MQFRGARITDLEDLVQHGEEFWTHTKYYKDGRPYSAKDVGSLCLNLILGPLGFITVLADDDDKCVGFGLVVVQPFIFDHSFKAGLELAYYIAPEYRGTHGVALLKEMEDQARLHDCAYLSMITMEDSDPETAARVYNKLGYTKNEVVYTKEL